MATIDFDSSFIGPIPGSEHDYLLWLTYEAHHAFEGTAGDMEGDIFPFLVKARSVSPDSEDPRVAVVKVICPKIRSLALTAEDSEDPAATVQLSLEPRSFSEEDTVPELLQATFDLTEGEMDIPDSANTPVGPTYRVLPGRRTRSFKYN